MTDLVSLHFIAMIPIDCKIELQIEFSSHLYNCGQKKLFLCIIHWCVKRNEPRKFDAKIVQDLSELKRESKLMLRTMPFIGCRKCPHGPVFNR